MELVGIVYRERSSVLIRSSMSALAIVYQGKTMIKSIVFYSVLDAGCD
jgi:hypothetical protein